MSMLIGLVARQNYAGAANDQAAVDLLINMLPNPDAVLAQSTNSSGAIVNGPSGIPHGGLLDQMSPTCLAQLRVELAALRAAIGTTNTL